MVTGRRPPSQLPAPDGYIVLAVIRVLGKRGCDVNFYGILEQWGGFTLAKHVVDTGETIAMLPWCNSSLVD